MKSGSTVEYNSLDATCAKGRKDTQTQIKLRNQFKNTY